MEFLTIDDLKTHSQDRFITDSTADFVTATDLNETQVIAQVRSKLNSRYDVDEIFAEAGEDRHPLIVMVCSMLLLNKIFARNAARKVPEDIKQAGKDALKWLIDVRDHNENPDGLPTKEVEEGEPTSDILWGTTSDENNFL